MLATQSKVTLSDNLIDLPTHKTCSKCGQSKLLCDFYKHKGGKYGVRSECKECKKEYYQDNKEYRNEYGRVWYEFNKERRNETSRVYYQNNKKRIKENNRVWAKNNPDKVRSIEAKRRAIKKLAYPLWARTGEIKQQIDRIYREAKDLELFHSESYHVDHIHPLQSNFICGLHVPANLRPLVGKENVSKNNSFTPYIEVATDVEIDMIELNKMVEEFNDSLAHNENLIYNVG
jgi:hypothetical protein